LSAAAIAQNYRVRRAGRRRPRGDDLQRVARELESSHDENQLADAASLRPGERHTDLTTAIAGKRAIEK
jgi:hypothetical protein